MKKAEILELILGIFLGFIIGFNILLILTTNPKSSKVLSSFFTSIKLSKFYVVSSGSMEPAIKVGSGILVVPKPAYSIGQVITFMPNGFNKTVVTHRIMKEENSSEVLGEKVYRTAGDANEDLDSWQINQKDIIGQVILTVPYLGYLVNFVKHPQGFIIFVIIPATIIIYEELKSVRKEFLKIFRRNLPGNLITLEKDRTGVFKVASVLPILGAALVFIAVSSSFFFDSELSINNILSAAATFPKVSPSQSPNAQTLVINEVLPDSSCSQGQTEAQWIEVYNGYSTTVNLKNFQISDGTNTADLVTASNIEVPSGGFALLAKNNAIWSNCYSDNGVITANLGGQLNIDTQFLALLDSEGNVIDTVGWGLGTGLEVKLDESIERKTKGLDTAEGTNFNPVDFQIKTTPTPGN